MDKQHWPALENAVQQMVEAEGLWFEGLEVRSAGHRWVLRALVDAADGVSLDKVAAVTSAISGALDRSELIGDVPYTLEVSSPGVDRPLTLPRHWTRALGHLVRVDLAHRKATGRVVQAEDTSAVLDVAGERVRVRYADVQRAVIEIEFRRVEPDS